MEILMSEFRHTIKVDYPNGNRPIFEEWFSENYFKCNTDRELMPVWFTSYFVNHDYGNDKRKKQELQEYVDSLDRNKKWFCIIQYDDGVLIDFKDLDVLQFNMSKNIGVPIPLMCKPQPYKFSEQKKWMANFVGSKTHPIRESAEQLKKHEDYYISFEPHNIDKYCEIISHSLFTLCYRGYGANSFRIAESIQYGSIPVYISDEFIIPFDLDFNEFGVVIKEEDKYRVDEILKSIPIEDIIKKQEKLSSVYNEYYTYEGCFDKIIKEIEAEYNKR